MFVHEITITTGVSESLHKQFMQYFWGETYSPSETYYFISLHGYKQLIYIEI